MFDFDKDKDDSEWSPKRKHNGITPGQEDFLHNFACSIFSQFTRQEAENLIKSIRTKKRITLRLERGQFYDSDTLEDLK